MSNPPLPITCVFFAPSFLFFLTSVISTMFNQSHITSMNLPILSPNFSLFNWWPLWADPPPPTKTWDNPSLQSRRAGRVQCKHGADGTAVPVSIYVLWKCHRAPGAPVPPSPSQDKSCQLLFSSDYKADRRQCAKQGNYAVGSRGLLGQSRVGTPWEVRAVHLGKQSVSQFQCFFRGASERSSQTTSFIC